ncbi:MAG: hypothetical protein E7022_00130 [Desulfovibrio desulfuricans]|nr:hypothetical protein [Desulfovibrio desulfuricans]
MNFLHRLPLFAILPLLCLALTPAASARADDSYVTIETSDANRKFVFHVHNEGSPTTTKTLSLRYGTSARRRETTS